MLTLEDLFTSTAGFGITTATPLQRAICRASDGLPLEDLWDYPEVRAAFGGVAPPLAPPSILVLLSAIRSAKSTLAAAKAVLCSQTVDLTGVIPGDEIRIPILATDKDAARATFTHMAGMLEAKPALRELLIGEPAADSLWLKHPSGHPIEVKVTALSKYGSTVVSRWLAGLILDEAPRMAGEDDGVRNLTEALHATRGRILPGGQTWLPGSPWGPLGPVYEMVQEHFGKPSEAICVVRAGGPAMNPYYWTPARCAKLKRDDPEAYRTDVEAKFRDAEEALFNSDQVEKCRRPHTTWHLPFVEGHHYVAAIDPATRSNGWTLLVAEHAGMGGPSGTLPVMKIAWAGEWKGTSDKPLRPFDVVSEIANILAKYELFELYTDQASADYIIDLGSQVGLTVIDDPIPSADRIDSVKASSRALNQGCLELHPHPTLRNDLIAVKKRTTVNSITLVLPKTSDGRHCDFVPPLQLIFRHIPDPPDESTPEGDPMLQRALADLEPSEDGAVDRAADVFL